MKLIGEAETQAFGKRVAKYCVPPMVIYLKGELGSGKTTFARGFIQSLGHEGNVKSPTFALVENYHFAELTLYHFDLYRLQDPLELEYLGLRDIASEEDVICLIEWPQRGGEGVPNADLIISFDYPEENRSVDLCAQSTRGQAVIDQI